MVDSGSRIPRLGGASITYIIQIASISTLTLVKVTRWLVVYAGWLGSSPFWQTNIEQSIQWAGFPVSGCMISMVLIYYVDNASEVDGFSLKCKTSTSHLSILDAGKRQVIMHKTGEFDKELLLRLSIEKGWYFVRLCRAMIGAAWWYWHPHYTDLEVVVGFQKLVTRWIILILENDGAVQI